MDTLETVQGGTQGAGAGSPEQQGAAPVGAQDATNASAVNSESQPAAVEGVTEGTDTTAGQEPPEGGTEVSHKKTLEERAREIAREEMAEFFRQNQEAQRPNFAPVETEEAVKRNIFNVQARIRAIEEEAALAEDGNVPPELLDEYWQRQKFVEDAKAALLENQKVRHEWETARGEEQRQQQFKAQVQTEIDSAVQALMTHDGTPTEVLQKGREFFNAECKANAFLQRQFDNIVLGKSAYNGFSGPEGAVLMARDYVKQHMGKKEQEVIQQREAAKEALPSGVTNTGIVVGNPQLDAAKAKAASGNAEDLAAYMALKRQAAQQAA